MPTYYEILKISSTASQKEIETVLDEQYNKWRRLVTHHNPNVVDESNRALHLLEQIRATLADPKERAKYDASLNVGGLADPEALVRNATSPPSTVPRTMQPISSMPPQAMQRVDAWLCGNCQSANAVGLQFCTKCGNQIGHYCPNCTTMTEMVNAYCPHCGANKEIVHREKQQQRISQLRAQIQTERAEIQFLERFSKKLVFFPGSREHILNYKIGFSPDNIALGVIYMAILFFCPFLAGGIIGNSDLAPWAALFTFIVGFVIVVWHGYKKRQSDINKLIQPYREHIRHLEDEIRLIRTGDGVQLPPRK